jgi:hypothetical protein
MKHRFLAVTALLLAATTGNCELRQVVINAEGRYFYNADFSDPSNRPNGVTVAVVDGRNGGTFLSLSTNGPATTSIRADLGLLVPGDKVLVTFGQTGSPGEDPGSWSSVLTQQPPWFSSAFPDPEEAPLGGVSPLSQLELLSPGQPQCFVFRYDFLGARGYPYVSNTVVQTAGYEPKMYAEEYTRPVLSDDLPVCQQLAADKPTKMVVCHYNFCEIEIMQEPSSTNMSPAHWVYYPGATLTAAITPGSSSLAVDKTSSFRAPNNDGTSLGNDVIAIIPVDAQGGKLWDQAEFAVVQSISGSQLTVLRGQFRTAAANYAAGSYVAPLSEPYNGLETYFRYNYSVNCPRDNQGRNCGDALAQLWRTRFVPGGELERIHGVAADVFFGNLGDLVIERNYDTDGDGVWDNGYDSRGYNLWGLGVYDYARKLRLVLGINRIFSSDAGKDWPRLQGVLTGMENEGLTQWDDPYVTLWPQSLNSFSYFEAHPATPYRESYIVTKFPTLPTNTPPSVTLNLSRLAWATAAIFNLRVTASGVDMKDTDKAFRIYDEFVNGTSNQPRWLGVPTGPVRRLATEAPDLLNGAGVSLTNGFVNAWNSSVATVSLDGDAMRVRAGTNEVGPDSETMTITYPNLTIPSGDLFFRFKLKLARLTFAPPGGARCVTASVDGRKANINTSDTVEAMAGDSDFTEVFFLFRGAGPATVNLNLQFEGRQDVWIKEFTVHNATDALARGFQNGVVLANPSENPYTFNLTNLFPGVALRRIQGNTWDDPVVNNGQPVGDTLTLPGWSGTFLSVPIVPPPIVKIPLKVLFDFSRLTGDRDCNLGERQPTGTFDSYADQAVFGATTAGYLNSTTFGADWVLLNDTNPDVVDSSAPANSSDFIANNNVIVRTRIERLVSGTTTEFDSAGILFGLTGAGSTRSGFLARVDRAGNTGSKIYINAFTNGVRGANLAVSSSPFNFVNNTAVFLELRITSDGVHTNAALKVFQDASIPGSGSNTVRLVDMAFNSASPASSITLGLTNYTGGFLGLYFEDNSGGAASNPVAGNGRFSNFYANVPSKPFLNQISVSGGVVTINFTADVDDASGNFKLQTAGTVAGPYGDENTAIISGSGPNFQAAVTMGGSARFYRIRRQ